MPHEAPDCAHLQNVAAQHAAHAHAVERLTMRLDVTVRRHAQHECAWRVRHAQEPLLEVLARGRAGPRQRVVDLQQPLQLRDLRAAMRQRFRRIVRTDRGRSGGRYEQRKQQQHAALEGHFGFAARARFAKHVGSVGPTPSPVGFWGFPNFTARTPE